MSKKKGKFKTNAFYHYAREFREHITEGKEIEKINWDDIFFSSLFDMHKQGEVINMNINAPPGSGKSTVGFAVAHILTKKLFNRSFSVTDIDRDQQEHSQTMRNPEVKNTVRVIDEWNELENTGENVTVEQALFNYFSDVMAQRNVHRISCSPKESIDKNALIYLEVISTDKVTKMTHCMIYYRLFSGGIENLQLLGHLSVDVSYILKQEWYKEYRRRKFEKMDLILKEGVFRPRELEYAPATLAVVDKLKNIAMMTNAINNEVINNYVNIEARKRKIPYSMAGEIKAVQRVKGILDLYKSIARIERDVRKSNEMLRKTATSAAEISFKDVIKERIKKLNLIKEELRNAIQQQEDELNRYINIGKKYAEVRI